MSLSHKQITKIFREVAGVIADEAERNPSFATELASAMRIITKEAKGTNKKNNKSSVLIPFDIFQVYHDQGIDGLQKNLQSLDIEQLRSITRENRFDPSRASAKWNEEYKDRFISLISDAVQNRSKQGEQFRNYHLPEEKSPTEENKTDQIESNVV